jgi:hypothetical protein
MHAAGFQYFGWFFDPTVEPFDRQRLLAKAQEDPYRRETFSENPGARNFGPGRVSVEINTASRYRDLPVGNPVQRGHRFQRKADSNPVIADSR